MKLIFQLILLLFCGGCNQNKIKEDKNSKSSNHIASSDTKIDCYIDSLRYLCDELNRNSDNQLLAINYQLLEGCLPISDSTFEKYDGLYGVNVWDNDVLTCFSLHGFHGDTISQIYLIGNAQGLSKFWIEPIEIYKNNKLNTMLSKVHAKIEGNQLVVIRKKLSTPIDLRKLNIMFNIDNFEYKLDTFRIYQ
jgi:hypothetical protein